MKLTFSVLLSKKSLIHLDYQNILQINNHQRKRKKKQLLNVKTNKIIILAKWREKKLELLFLMHCHLLAVYLKFPTKQLQNKNKKKSI